MKEVQPVENTNSQMITLVLMFPTFSKLLFYGNMFIFFLFHYNMFIIRFKNNNEALLLKKSSDDYNVNILITRWKEKDQNKHYCTRVVTLIFTFMNICQIFSSNHTS